EALVRVHTLRRDADHRRVQRVERLGVVAVRAELPRALRRVVAGIEEEHHALAAMVGQLETAARALELEVRSGLAYVRMLRHEPRMSGAAVERVERARQE